MNENRKFPGIFGWLAVLLLGTSFGIAWWLNRPLADGGGKPPLAADDLEVACTGRVATKNPMISLDPEYPGKVTRIYVGERPPENRVKKGDKVLEIDPRIYKIKLDEATKAMEGAKFEVDKAELDEKMFPFQLAGRRESLAGAAANVAAAGLDIQVFEQTDLAQRKPGEPPGEIFKLRKQTLEERVKALKGLEAVEKQSLKMLEESGPKMHALAVQAARTRLDAAKAAYDEALHAVEECTLRAPQDGTILQLNVAVGSGIAQGTPIPFVVFAPDGPLIVRADLEQEFVYRVKPGMKVELRDEARSNSPVWTGKVETVSDYIAQKRNILLDPGEMNDVRTAECVITIDPANEVLRIGQRMRVRIQTK